MSYRNIHTDDAEGAPQSSRLALAGVAGRVLLVAIFILSGLGKLADPKGTIHSIASAGVP